MDQPHLESVNVLGVSSIIAKIRQTVSGATCRVSMLGNIFMKEDSSLKVGARRRWTRAERNMRVNGIPMTAYRIHAALPVAVMG